MAEIDYIDPDFPGGHYDPAELQDLGEPLPPIPEEPF